MVNLWRSQMTELDELKMCINYDTYTPNLEKSFKKC